MALICLSYVNPAATQHAHRLTRRLRQHFGPGVRIVVGLWAAKPAAEGSEELMRAVRRDLLATSLGQAVRRIAEDAEPTQPEVRAASMRGKRPAAARPAATEGRLDALRHLAAQQLYPASPDVTSWVALLWRSSLHDY